MNKIPLLIVGLGNPGNEYALTRHNFGFLAIDLFWDYLNEELLVSPAPFSAEKKFQAKVSKAQINNTLVYLLKPETFMNLSGKSVKALLDFYKIPLENILIIHDELDLPIGKIRLSLDSSAAGHNGVQSIIDSLGSKNFHRLRLGIDKLEGIETHQIPADQFVLSSFLPSEEKVIQEIAPQILSAIMDFISGKQQQ